ncbi:hypothetical protein FGO68_gene13189 [Halteria grandinella]|uniref:Uncharacterized protein n=1 Tax=Halteria grandinella TaxID=5974 RepID=A0A8J8NYE5_HALGN|nr:hypothetical protein FGO68_gene13189 [Halteria grandinella]
MAQFIELLKADPLNTCSTGEGSTLILSLSEGLCVHFSKNHAVFTSSTSASTSSSAFVNIKELVEHLLIHLLTNDQTEPCPLIAQ